MRTPIRCAIFEGDRHLVDLELDSLPAIGDVVRAVHDDGTSSRYDVRDVEYGSRGQEGKHHHFLIVERRGGRPRW